MADADSDLVRIHETLENYERALNASDSAGIVATYTEDGEFYAAEQPTVAGHADLLRAYSRLFEELRFDMKFSVASVTVSGDVGYVTATSVGRATVLTPGIVIEEENRDLFVLVKVDDAWKIARCMFNKASTRAADG